MACVCRYALLALLAWLARLAAQEDIRKWVHAPVEAVFVGREEVASAALDRTPRTVGPVGGREACMERSLEAEDREGGPMLMIWRAAGRARKASPGEVNACRTAAKCGGPPRGSWWAAAGDRSSTIGGL